MSGPEMTRIPPSRATIRTARMVTIIMSSRRPQAPVDDTLDLAGHHARAGLERLLEKAHGHRLAGLDGGGELLRPLDVLPGGDQPLHALSALLHADHVTDCESH